MVGRPFAGGGVVGCGVCAMTGAGIIANPRKTQVITIRFISVSGIHANAS
jgi:hypothetical protein